MNKKELTELKSLTELTKTEKERMKVLGRDKWKDIDRALLRRVRRRHKK